MKTRRSRIMLLALSVILLTGILMLSACGGESTPPETSPADTENKTTSEIESTEEPVETEAIVSEEPVVEETPDPNPVQTLLDSAELTIEGLLAMIADKDAVTIVEYEALILARTKFEIDEETLEFPYECPAIKAYVELIKYDSEYTLPSYEEQQALIMKLLTHSDAKVRAYSIAQMQSMWGTTDEHQNAVVELLQTDKDPMVIKAALRSFQNELASNTGFGELAFEYVVSDDARVRAAVAGALGSTWNKNLEGGIEALIELLGDSDQIVRAAAARNCGRLGDDRLIEPIVAILSNADDTDTHYDAFNTLVNMWYYYPAHDTYSEAAYNATLAYLKTTPRSTATPNWGGISSMKQISEEKFEAWKEVATFFKPADLCKALADIATDTDCSHMIRSTSLAVIAVHGTRANLESIRNTISASGEGIRDEERLVGEIDKLLEKM